MNVQRHFLLIELMTEHENTHLIICQNVYRLKARKILIFSASWKRQKDQRNCQLAVIDREFSITTPPPR